MGDLGWVAWRVYMRGRFTVGGWWRTEGDVKNVIFRWCWTSMFSPNVVFHNDGTTH